MAKMRDDLEQAKQVADNFEKSMKDLRETDRFAPVKETEGPQMSQKDINSSKDIYLKPVRSLSDGQKFDENYRDEYNFFKEYVCFIAEHKEIIGEKIEIWTKKYKGIPAEYWEVPPGKVVWGPRYLADRIAECHYRRLKTEDHTQTASGHVGTFTGALVVDHEVARLTATPVTKGRKSVFMSA